MSMQSPSIAAGPTELKVKQYDTRAQIVKAMPGTPYQEVVNDQVIDRPNEPMAAGHLRVHWPSGTMAGAIFTLYCGVEIEGVLEWKPVKLGSDAVDQYSKRPVPAYSDERVSQTVTEGAIARDGSSLYL